MLVSEATASFACLGCQQLHLNPKRRIRKESAEGWKAITTLTENALFRSYGTFAYLLHAHIRNINMRKYITSAYLIIMPGLNVCGLQSKLLITPLSE